MFSSNEETLVLEQFKKLGAEFYTHDYVDKCGPLKGKIIQQAHTGESTKNKIEVLILFYFSITIHHSYVIICGLLSTQKPNKY